MTCILPRWIACSCAIFLAITTTLWAQQNRSITKHYDESVKLLTNAAGTIFRGTVISIQAIHPSRPGAVETVEVKFHVDEGFRGTRKGQTVTLRQWSALWFQGQRYTVGERVLLFLYPPSKLGLTSAVGGQIGRFPIDGAGTVLSPGIGSDNPGTTADQPLAPFGPSDSAYEGLQSQRLPYKRLARSIRRAMQE
jgi:hypothetical protein